MTTNRHLERDLPELLVELAMGPFPDYRDDVVQQTARTRQRPAWTFPERWLSMDITMRRASVAARWRPIGLVLLVVALLLIFIVGASIGTRRSLPSPLGPAVNGLIAYAADGDIYLGDPDTGATRPIITGPESDSLPRFSTAGNRFVFLRQTPSGSSDNLLIANADGTGIRVLTPTPLIDLVDGDWSSDGHTIVVVSSIAGRQGMSTIDVETGSIRTLEAGIEVRGARFIPPEDIEIAFIGGDEAMPTTYAVGVRGTEPRVLLSHDALEFSPDGKYVAYEIRDKAPDGGDRLQVHVAAMDGTNDRLIENPDGVRYQGSAHWSPDGKKLLIERAYVDHTLRLVIVPVNGGQEQELSIVVRGGFGELGWSPDGTMVVFSPENPTFDSVVVEVANGSFRSVPRWWTSSWQRLAP